jgi:hypothetical protein
VTFRGQSWEHWQITDQLRSIGVDFVYHWTPADSLFSILRDGILSRSTLEYRRIQHQPHNYGSAEKEAFLRNFVALSFKPKRLMMDEWRLQQPVVIAIDTDILATEGTLFVPGNTADGKASLAQFRTSKGQAALRELLGHRGLAVQSEAWVPWLVPRESIRSVHVPNEALATIVLAQISQGSSSYPQTPVFVAHDMFPSPGFAELHRRLRDADVEDLPF